MASSRLSPPRYRMSFASATILLPTPDTTWRVWKPQATSAGETISTPAEVRPQGKNIVIGLPATACRSIGMVLPNADHDVLEQIIITQLDRKGLKLRGGHERNFRWHLLTQTSTTATVSADVLAEVFPDDLALPQAADYTAALRLLALPSGQIIITEEHGSLVLAAGYQGKLYHSHIIAPGALLMEELAQEITIARLALNAELGEGFVTGVTLLGTTWDRGTTENLENKLDLPVRTLAQLAPNADLDTRTWSRLLPDTVRNAQLQAARRSKWLRFSILGGLLAVALIFLAFAYLTFQERTAAQLTADVEATSAPATLVKKTAEQWKTLAPAIESKRYPMVILAAITKLMPPSGIVIRDFEIKDHEIDIRGEARDTQTAVQFVEDLQKDPLLSRYTWSKPQPTVREKTALFRAQGKAL